MSITHTTVTALPDDPAYDVSADEWNDDHTLSAGVSGETICRVNTGTYTGDGAAGPGGQAITGIGFAPLYVSIYPSTAGPSNKEVWSKIKGAAGAVRHRIAASYHQVFNDGILSLDADGFTVSDLGANVDPNTATVTYIFVAWG